MKSLEDSIRHLPQLERTIRCLKKDFNALEYVKDLVDITFDASYNLDISFLDQEDAVQVISTNLSSLVIPTEFRPDIVVDNYNELLTITGQALYEFAQVNNSQGFRWIPGSFGGTYYGSGLYYWNGTNWVHDNDAIFNAFQDFTILLNNLTTDLAQEVTFRISGDQNLQTQLDNHIALTNPHNTTFTETVTADPNTDITPAEAEELTDGSITQLHDHPYRFQLFSKVISNDTTIPGINNTDVLAVHNSIAFTNTEFGLYEIDWGFLWSLNFGGDDFIGEIRVDGTAIWQFRQEPKDVTGGEGIVLALVGGGTEQTGTNQRSSNSDFDVVPLNPGPHTIELLWSCAPGGGGDRATIYQSKLLVKQIGR